MVALFLVCGTRLAVYNRIFLGFGFRFRFAFGFGNLFTFLIILFVIGELEIGRESFLLDAFPLAFVIFPVYFLLLDCFYDSNGEGLLHISDGEAPKGLVLRG